MKVAEETEMMMKSIQTMNQKILATLGILAQKVTGLSIPTLNRWFPSFGTRSIRRLTTIILFIKVLLERLDVFLWQYP